MFEDLRRDAIQIFLLAFFMRVCGVVVTTFTNLNPDEGGDTTAFAIEATMYASGELPLSYLVDSLGSTIPTWGFFLSPFWLFPGPSQVYARFAIALIGAYAIFNIYILIKYHVNMQAALVAVVPLIFFPSFVALHSVILRDAAILCGLVVAIRLITMPGRLSKPRRYALAIVAISFASLLRLENLPIYLVMGIVGYLTWRFPRHYHLPTLVATAVAGLVAYPILERLFHWLGILRGRSFVDFLVFMRNARIHEGGRTQYLTEVPVESLTDVLLYTPYGAFYFLFVPFPWMIGNPIDYFTVVESLIMLFFFVAAIRGTIYLARRNLPLTVALITGFALFIALYGIISVNVGTSVRQRQTFSWVIFALGGIGIAEHYRFKLNWSLRVFRNSDENPS